MKLHQEHVVYRWYGEFNRGRISLQEEFREGRLKSALLRKLFMFPLVGGNVKKYDMLSHPSYSPEPMIPFYYLA